MLNFLTKRANPTPFFNITPVEVAAFGEPAIIARLAETRPDCIALVHIDASGLGRGYFGKDPLYGKTVVDWVKANYEAVETIGAEPLQDGRFGIKLYRKRP
jgi:hypothetical protein